MADQQAMPHNLGAAVSALDARVIAGASASAAVPAAEHRTGSRFVRFKVGSTVYAVGEAFVIELDRVPRITIVPQTPEWLRGVTSLRGDILSVVDLRIYLGLDPTPSSTGRMLVLRLPSEECALGLLVDAVEGIVTIDREGIHPPASALEGPLAPFLSGMSVVGDQLLAVLDLDRFLRSSDIRQFDETHEDSRCEAR
jgi:purine-binding chemotaxis protein CheW